MESAGRSSGSASSLDENILSGDELADEQTLRMPEGTPIDSSECCYCFLDKYNRDGLFLCMHCDTCLCADHVSIHYKREEHPYYLRIVRKPAKTLTSLSVEDKLRIIVSGDDAAFFELETSVFRWPNLVTSLEDDLITDEVSMSVAMLLSCPENRRSIYLIPDSKRDAGDSPSAGPLADVTETQCPHLTSVIPADVYSTQSYPEKHIHLRRIKNVSMERVCCEFPRCDKSENLWMCLQCGYVGCGRKFWDGTGGNNHAISHYELNSSGEAKAHCVALKISSLSLTNCELYCYACDDSVTVDVHTLYNYLLSSFGPEVASLCYNQQQAEKSLADQAMDRTVAMHHYGLSDEDAEKDADGNEFEPHDLIGPLRNHGNTCFANSVVNALRISGVFSLGQDGSALVRNFMQAHWETCRASQPEDCYLCQKYRLAMYMDKTINDAPGLSSVTRHLLSSVPHASTFIQVAVPTLTIMENRGRQHDASEFLALLLQRDPTIENALALPGVRNEIRCRVCGGHKYSLEPSRACFLSLSCSIFDKVTDCEAGMPINLMDSLVAEASGSSNAIDGLLCPLCGTANQCDFEPSVTSGYSLLHKGDMPDIVTLVANRQMFDPKSFRAVKLMTRLLGVESIDLSRICSLPDTPSEESANSTAWERALPGSTQAHEDAPAESSVLRLLDLGLADRTTCERALRLTGGDVERAVDAILRHIEDGSVFTAGQSAERAALASETERDTDRLLARSGTSSPDPLPYDLLCFVYHRGNTLDGGHYVLYIRAATLTDAECSAVGIPLMSRNLWVEVNDDRLSIVRTVPQEQGYVYFFRQRPRR